VLFLYGLPGLERAVHKQLGHRRVQRVADF
jgi:hypothetical protein